MQRLFNTLTRKKETFRPLKDNKVGLYTCGPSVYTTPHIGNYRTYLFEDILKRYLIYKGYKVKHVMNITDVEDKTMRVVRKDRKRLMKTTKFYTKIFLEDTRKLNIIPADYYPRATQHINEMVRLIKRLMKRGYAYKWDDGNIYYRISKFKSYGKLSRLKVTKDMFKRRKLVDDYFKWEKPGDFVLWKSYRKSDGDIFWNTELGKGRPGWNIECSAMSMKYLGEHFDIHTGGVDNIFSHHENEIAQSEGATGKKFVNYWLHSKHLMINGRKMSKSLGNCCYFRDLVKSGFSPMTIRYALVSTHYRRRLNFTFGKVRRARNEIRECCDYLKKIKMLRNGIHSDEVSMIIKETINGFEKSMDDDLDVPKAMKECFEFIRKIYALAERKNLDRENVKDVMKVVKKINFVFGFALPC